MRLAKAGLSKRRERVGFGGDGVRDTGRPNIERGVALWCLAGVMALVLFVFRPTEFRSSAQCRRFGIRYDSLPSPRQMQTRVQMWKQLWNRR
jgi:hypothetical protein